MATVLVLDMNLKPFKLPAPPQARDLLSQVRQLERQTFPKHEAMDFHHELCKRNMVLTIIIDTTAAPSPQTEPPSVRAYMLHQRARSAATLHKLCVAETSRRRGLARNMLRHLLTDLQRQGCAVIQLWVDVNRVPARALYASLDFTVTSHLPDYYALGRHAVRMKVVVE